MNTFKTPNMLVTASILAFVCVSNTNAQEAKTYGGENGLPTITVTPNANVAPSWQAVCGYKWRMFRTATGAAGRDAYLAFMRTPSEQGGCGAGEATANRPVRVGPRDEMIKQFLDQQKAKQEKQGAIETERTMHLAWPKHPKLIGDDDAGEGWQEAGRRPRRADDDNTNGQG